MHVTIARRGIRLAAEEIWRRWEPVNVTVAAAKPLMLSRISATTRGLVCATGPPTSRTRASPGDSDERAVSTRTTSRGIPDGSAVTASGAPATGFDALAGGGSALPVRSASLVLTCTPPADTEPGDAGVRLDVGAGVGNESGDSASDGVGDGAVVCAAVAGTSGWVVPELAVPASVTDGGVTDGLGDSASVLVAVAEGVGVTSGVGVVEGTRSTDTGAGCAANPKPAGNP